MYNVETAIYIRVLNKHMYIGAPDVERSRKKKLNFLMEEFEFLRLKENHLNAETNLLTLSNKINVIKIKIL